MPIKDNFYIYWQEKIQKQKFLRRVLIFWAIYSVLFYFIVAIWILFQSQGWKILALGLGIGLFVRFVLTEIIHVIHRKQHPYQRLNLATPSSFLFSLKDTRADAFPSEHSAILSAFSAVIFWFFPVLGLGTFVTAAILPCARIIIGYHDLADVLAGWVVGLVSAFVLLYFLVPLIFTRHLF